jgi:hypothetical protein
MTDKDSDVSQDDSSQDGRSQGDRSQDDRILCFLPSESIDLDVIRADLHSYLGQDATVIRGKHPKVGVGKQELGWLLNMAGRSTRIFH